MKEKLKQLNKKQIIIIAAAVIIVIACIIAAIVVNASKKPQTEEITEPVSVIQDADDNDNSVIQDTEKGNLIEITDENGNVLTIIPIYDASGSTIIGGYIKSAKDASGNEITDEGLIDKVVAITTDASSGVPVYSVTLKDGKSFSLIITQMRIMK